MRPTKALLGLVCFGAMLASNANAATVTVHVFDFDFSTNPSGGQIIDPTINVGDTIHWQWDGSFMHSSTSVTGIAESWNSGDHNIGATFDHTFTHAGTFWYFCDMHGFDNGNGTAGGMAGTITVNAVPEPMTCAALAIGLSGLVARRRRKA